MNTMGNGIYRKIFHTTWISHDNVYSVAEHNELGVSVLDKIITVGVIFALF